MITEMDNYYDFDLNELLKDPMLPEPVLYPQNDLVLISQRLNILINSVSVFLTYLTPCLVKNSYDDCRYIAEEFTPYLIIRYETEHPSIVAE